MLGGSIVIKEVHPHQLLSLATVTFTYLRVSETPLTQEDYFGLFSGKLKMYTNHPP